MQATLIFVIFSVALGAVPLLTQFAKTIRRVRTYTCNLTTESMQQQSACSICRVNKGPDTVNHAVQGTSLCQFRHTTLHAWNIASPQCTQSLLCNLPVACLRGCKAEANLVCFVSGTALDINNVQHLCIAQHVSVRGQPKPLMYQDS